MSEHGWAVDLAKELIAENGRDVELISYIETGPEYNRDRIETSVTIKAVSTTIRRDEIPQGLIEKVTRQYLVSSEVEPKTNMRIKDGSTYSILNVQQVYPGDQSILFKVFVGG